MQLVFKSEILHRREYLAEKIGNQYHRNYPPVEVAAIDIYGKRIRLGFPQGTDLHINSLIIEPKICPLELEVLWCAHKLQETWDGKHGPMEEFNFGLLEARSCDPINKCFQVSTNTTEPKLRSGSVTGFMSDMCMSCLSISRFGTAARKKIASVIRWGMNESQWK
jgi:hypothetical protein